jgi:6-phosphofructokinase
MRLAILTGGGDVPGLNSCIKVAVMQAAANGWDVLGFRRGWGVGCCILIQTATARRRVGYNLWRRILSVPLTARAEPSCIPRRSIRARSRRTTYLILWPFLNTAIVNGDRFDCMAHVLAVVEALGIDGLIAMSKTMNNDVYGTDYCIWFSTAITRSVDAITALRTPTASHERIAIVELFGRNSGQTALIACYLADTDRTLISEVPVDMERLADLIMTYRNRNPSSSSSHNAMVVVSEGSAIEGGDIIAGGAEDAYGHLKLRGIGRHMADLLTQQTGVSTVN